MNTRTFPIRSKKTATQPAVLTSDVEDERLPSARSNAAVDVDPQALQYSHTVKEHDRKSQRHNTTQDQNRLQLPMIVRVLRRHTTAQDIPCQQYDLSSSPMVVSADP